MENTDTPIARNVAANVRRLRHEHGLTLDELSTELYGVGHPLSLKSLSKIETGRRGVSVDDLAALADVFRVSCPTLMALAELAADSEYSDALDAWQSAVDESNAKLRAAGDRLRDAEARVRVFSTTTNPEPSATASEGATTATGGLSRGELSTATTESRRRL